MDIGCRLHFLFCYTTLGVSLALFLCICSPPPHSAERPPSLSSLPSMDSLAPPLGLCRPRTHIMFLKTHKTASSTVLNVLYRFGEGRGLQFALPLGYQFGYPMHFIAHRVKGYRGPHAVEFSIMGNHMRFNKVEVRFPEAALSASWHPDWILSRTSTKKILNAREAYHYS